MSPRNEPAFREQGGPSGPEINPASRAHCNPANPHATEPAEPARPPRVCWPRPTAAAISRRGGQGAPQRPSGALHPIRQPPAASPRSPQSAGLVSRGEDARPGPASRTAAAQAVQKCHCFSIASRARISLLPCAHFATCAMRSAQHKICAACRPGPAAALPLPGEEAWAPDNICVVRNVSRAA